MLGAIIETVGLICALMGSIHYFRKVSWPRSAIALSPIILYVLGQVIPHYGSTPEHFRTYYLFGLGLMGMAGFLGIVLMVKAPTE